VLIHIHIGPILVWVQKQCDCAGTAKNGNEHFVLRVDIGTEELSGAQEAILDSRTSIKRCKRRSLISFANRSLKGYQAHNPF